MSVYRMIRECRSLAVAARFLLLSIFVLIFTQKALADKFLVATDIHFNPYVTCQSNVTPCPVIEALREAPSDQWAEVLKQYDTQLISYGKDTNYVLLESSLAELKRVAENDKAKFVLLLGDFLGHDYMENFQKYSEDKSEAAYTKFVKKTFEFLNNKVNKTFPDLNVYSVVGNNDSYGKDYESVPNGAFFRDTANIWSQLIRTPAISEAMQHSFVKGGYYAIEQGNLRLIVLNTSLFSKKAIGIDIDAAAQEELDWLYHELVSAHAQQQKVLIAVHIADTVDVYASLKMNPYDVVDLWKPQYTQIFQNDLQKFSADIMGVLAGHAHSDWFQVLSPSTVIVGTPAISPQFGNNPGFKVFEYNDSFTLSNYTTYYFNLNDTKVWNKEYSFNSVYQPDCVNCKLIDGMNLLKPVGNLAEQYKLYFAVGTNAQPITKTNKWLPYYWCAVHNATQADYVSCLSMV